LTCAGLSPSRSRTPRVPTTTAVTTTAASKPDPHVVAHLGDRGHRHPARPVARRHRRPAGHHRREPAQPAPEAVRQRPAPGQQGAHDGWPAVIGQGELDVVDLAGQAPGAVDDLAVEQLEGQQELAPGLLAHDPALVTIMRGMVAAATTLSTTR
jgi:hypothetical protein